MTFVIILTVISVVFVSFTFYHFDLISIMIYFNDCDFIVNFKLCNNLGLLSHNYDLVSHNLALSLDYDLVSHNCNFLFHNIDIYQFLDLPKNIIFLCDRNGFPYYTLKELKNIIEVCYTIHNITIELLIR